VFARYYEYVNIIFAILTNVNEYGGDGGDGGGGGGGGGGGDVSNTR